MAALGPFAGRRFSTKEKVSVPAEGDAGAMDKVSPRFVVQRREDQKYLGNDGKPTSDSADAEVHDSQDIARIWAERATKEKPGVWEAVPHPEDLEPEDDDFRKAA